MMMRRRTAVMCIYISIRLSVWSFFLSKLSRRGSDLLNYLCFDDDMTCQGVINQAQYRSTVSNIHVTVDGIFVEPCGKEIIGVSLEFWVSHVACLSLRAGREGEGGGKARVVINGSETVMGK
ncbi:hypothetical protein F4778DRAFT_197182 [Xylariomycetidae sp. FL2044]|nr:hypothetical protein F4778DRAFT_197182 [Xylariomycetidae sp. FL2044]